VIVIPIIVIAYFSSCSVTLVHDLSKLDDN